MRHSTRTVPYNCTVLVKIHGGSRDTHGTRYGEGRASPRSFLTHHVANISTAIQTADAQTILNAASARMLRVSFGVM
jgi:hypothetical protein